MYWRYENCLIAATSLYEPSGIQIMDHSTSHHLVSVATSLICDHMGVVGNGLKRNTKKYNRMATSACRKTQESKKNSLFRIHLHQSEYGRPLQFEWGLTIKHVQC